jgi:hypothetical protein
LELKCKSYKRKQKKKKKKRRKRLEKGPGQRFGPDQKPAHGPTMQTRTGTLFSLSLSLTVGPTYQRQVVVYLRPEISPEISPPGFLSPFFNSRLFKTVPTPLNSPRPLLLFPLFYRTYRAAKLP